MAARRYTPAEIRTALEQLARTQGVDVTMAAFTRATGISSQAVYRHFESWAGLRGAAGLPARARRRAVHSDKELLAEYHRVTKELGREPSQRLFDARSAFSANTLAARFGNKKELRWAYIRYTVELYLAERWARGRLGSEGGPQDLPQPGGEPQPGRESSARDPERPPSCEGEAT